MTRFVAHNDTLFAHNDAGIIEEVTTDIFTSMHYQACHPELIEACHPELVEGRHAAGLGWCSAMSIMYGSTSSLGRTHLDWAVNSLLQIFVKHLVARRSLKLLKKFQ